MRCTGRKSSAASDAPARPRARRASAALTAAAASRSARTCAGVIISESVQARWDADGRSRGGAHVRERVGDVRIVCAVGGVAGELGEQIEEGRGEVAHASLDLVVESGESSTLGRPEAGS